MRDSSAIDVMRSVPSGGSSTTVPVVSAPLLERSTLRRRKQRNARWRRLTPKNLTASTVALSGHVAVLRPPVSLWWHYYREQCVFCCLWESCQRSIFYSRCTSAVVYTGNFRRCCSDIQADKQWSTWLVVYGWSAADQLTYSSRRRQCTFPDSSVYTGRCLQAVFSWGFRDDCIHPTTTEER